LDGVSDAELRAALPPIVELAAAVTGLGGLAHFISADIENARTERATKGERWDVTADYCTHTVKGAGAIAPLFQQEWFLYAMALVNIELSRRNPNAPKDVATVTAGPAGLASFAGQRSSLKP
jgi:hypothetical protein